LICGTIMSEKEQLIDLSYAIAVKVFEKHAFEPHPVNNALCEICNRECGNIVHKWGHFSVDPAASMELLKKCAEKLSKSNDRLILSFEQGMWHVTHTDIVAANVVWAEAPTLELAIAKFALKLYQIKGK
jgi:hypothetical protein